MKRTLALAACFVLALSTTVSAGPQTDFSKGKTSVDLTVMSPFLKSQVHGGPTEWDRKTGLEGRITTGLGDKLGVQYNYSDSPGSKNGWDNNLKTHELNLLYKIDKHFYAVAGVNRLSGYVGVPGRGQLDVKADNHYEVGIGYITKFNDKLTGWAMVAGGNGNQTLEAGLAYPLSDNADINIFGRYKKFYDVKVESYGDQNFRMTNTAVGLGVTFRF